jgi:phage terminase large subunit GpA-like protein
MDERAALLEMEQATRQILRPPPDLTVSQWADANRRLSSESSPEPFAWRTARAEYQRGIMDAFSDPRNRRVVVKSSAQVGKTSIVENVVGFHVDQDPSPILVVEPTLDMGETMSKDRFMPMFRDTPALRGKVADPRSRDSGNTLLHKSFPGGHLTIAGANSPASLASRPIRVLLCDEIDRFPASAGPEGSPVKLAIKRTNNFWNRRIGLFSTPTDEDVGIDAEYKASDQRRFFVACLECGDEQPLEWKHVKWTLDDGSDAKYCCSECGALLDETQRDRMVAAGEWRATAPFRGVAGFHVNELYSPWRSFADVVTEFLEAKDEPEKLRVWVNTSLGEAWKPTRPGVSANELEEEKGLPIGEIPGGALVLTLGVDTQGDRLALQLVGWGRGKEQWTIDNVELPGDPNLDEAWDKLTEYRRQVWPHPLGGEIKVSMTGIDSGGHHSQKVVAYAREFRAEGVVATKGLSVPSPTMLRMKPTKVDYKANGKVVRKGAELWLIGTDTAKSAIDSKLRAESDRRKIHFAEKLGADYFRQLTAEIYDKKKKKWINPKKRRNEAIDTMVIASAITMHPWLRLDVATEMKWRALEAKLGAAPVAQVEKGPPAAAPQTPKPLKRRSESFGSPDWEL